MSQRNKKKKKVLILDAGYHGGHGTAYRALEKYYKVDYCSSMNVFYSKIWNSKEPFKNHWDLVIMVPFFYPYHHFHDIPDFRVGQELYRRHFQTMHHCKVIVWAHTKEAALDHWGDNVKMLNVVHRHEKIDFIKWAKEVLEPDDKDKKSSQ